MEMDALCQFLGVKFNEAIGAYQSYQVGRITRKEFQHTLALLADSATQHITLSYEGQH